MSFAGAVEPSVSAMDSTSSSDFQAYKGKRKERLAFSMALDLMFNGQNIDYVDRPMSFDVFDKMVVFEKLNKGDRIGIVGPGGGRLINSLLERGLRVDAFEGRIECVGHLKSLFGSNENVSIRPYDDLKCPGKRDEMLYKALFSMDDLRAFRDNEAWTEDIKDIVGSKGYFVYSQISNKLPKKKNSLPDYFKMIGNYNVSQETADQIRASYFGIEKWDPEDGEYQTAKQALKLVESATSLRRNILSGVEIRYFVWRKK